MPLQFTGDEGAAVRGAVPVNQVRDHFLADPGFAKNQHLRMRARGFEHAAAHRRNRFTVA